MDCEIYFTPASIGKKASAVAVLEVTSVKNVTTVAIIKMIRIGCSAPIQDNCSPNQVDSPDSRKAKEIYELTYFDKLICAKKFQRKKDERDKPLAKYREEELARMHKNFFEDDWAYAYKRFCFVHKIPEPSTQMAQD